MPTESTNRSSAPSARVALDAKLAALEVPAPWVAETTSNWDMNKPWSEGRQEIRRLLSVNTEAARREAIKLMWDYRQKDDMGNGHEYGMYLFLGGEDVWAIHAFEEELSHPYEEYPPYFAVRSLAALYAEEGLFEEAIERVTAALDFRPPDPKWIKMREAELHDTLGDVYAAWGKLDDAKRHYQVAIDAYPTAKPPYGRHLLKRRAAKVAAKRDLLSIGSFAEVALRDGVYRHTALGYSGDIHLTLTVRGGELVDIGVKHQEKIDQGAAKLIPTRIVDQQSLAVDGVTGATVTVDAIIGGTLEGLRKAGLE